MRSQLPFGNLWLQNYTNIVNTLIMEIWTKVVIQKNKKDESSEHLSQTEMKQNVILIVKKKKKKKN